MISQNIFSLAVDFYGALRDPDVSERDPMPYTGNDYRTLGFSPSAIVSVIVLGSLMVIFIIGIGYIPYRKCMPLAGSNSIAFSAASHHIFEEEQDDNESSAAFEKLHWSAMQTSQDGVGHCGFTSKPVTPPGDGAVYAGKYEKIA